MQNNSNNSDVKRLSDMVKDIKFAMMTTVNAEDASLRARPMTLQETEFDGDFWFFVGRSSAAVQDLLENEIVNLAFSDPSNNRYVSATGIGVVVFDPEKAEELWTPAMKAWFPKGPTDPELGLICVHVNNADCWDSPSSTVVQLYGFAKSLLTGKRPGSEIGKQQHIVLEQ